MVGAVGTAGTHKGEETGCRVRSTARNRTRVRSFHHPVCVKTVKGKKLINYGKFVGRHNKVITLYKLQFEVIAFKCHRHNVNKIIGFNCKFLIPVFELLLIICVIAVQIVYLGS